MSVRERVVLIGSADERLQVRVIRTQVTVIWWLLLAAVTETVTLWHYPLLQGRLLTPLHGDGGDPVLWVRDDLDGCGGTPVTAWGLGYRPGPPRTAPRVRIPPSPRGTTAGHPVAVSPWCCGPGRLTVDPEFLEEEARPAHADLG